MLPSAAVCTVGLGVARARPQIGIAIALLGLLFPRQLDQFVRYRCPQCGIALEILAELA